MGAFYKPRFSSRLRGLLLHRECKKLGRQPPVANPEFIITLIKPPDAIEAHSLDSRMHLFVNTHCD